MRLRSITLAGFKTFANKTEIVFDPGVTAIVGPNGTGKSNIVDAFKWVLGETQARDLRGKKMEEVIYAGGSRRPRAASAEVVLGVENDDRRLAVDYAEVELRRRVDRSGHSDYFLNGARVRRRDLVDLLSSTGLVTDSYAIVDQRDIEAIISATAEQRRLLLEAAAQVSGVKARRNEAAARLSELAENLVRLEDLRGEIEPRLEAVRAQATLAREAAAARSRLELLRGSIAWEEWREARDAHRRASTQLQSVERRLEDSRRTAGDAEREYRARHAALRTAQDRRLGRQQALGGHRLQVSEARHALALAEEKERGQAALAEAARAEEEELGGRLGAASTQAEQLAADLRRAEEELARVPAAARPPDGVDRAARLTSELSSARAALAEAEARARVLRETVDALREPVETAERDIESAEREAEAASLAAGAAEAASARLGLLRAELAGLESLHPQPRTGMKRLGDVVLASAGYEAALSAVLGPLVDAWVAPDEAAALRGAGSSAEQVTVLYPDRAEPDDVDPGSLYWHVRCDPGFERIGSRLLGAVVVGRDVSQEGVYRQAGLVRAGSDPRVALAARRRALMDEAARLQPEAGEAGGRRSAADMARARLEQIRAAAGQRARLESALAGQEKAQIRAAQLADRLPELETAAAEAELLRVDHQTEVRRLDLERARWRDRAQDLRRQKQAADQELARLAQAREGRSRRAAEAERRAAEVAATRPGLERAIVEASAALEAAEKDAPEEEAELAETARLLVAAEEARIDARLKTSTYEGSADLLRRDVELSSARMEQLRTRMPEGLAPEDVPGGKAREREMRQLERRLDEIGPVNELAEAEAAELDERYSRLLEQLDDITRARANLDELIGRLRQEEESRYEAVFGAVAANFQEYFQELTGGGKATLNHATGAEGPRSGVEILVQPPRKRAQNISLLSSGERSMTALALVLALQEINPAPFTVLDEVDAALDDANVGRFGEVLQRLGRQRQFMVITHNHLTMASASALYGVHLDESGSSHLVSVRLQDVRPERSERSEVRSA